MADILIGTANTNANGIAEFSTLPPGNYKYVQTSAKTGYTIDATPHTFTVTSATPIDEDRTNSPTETGTLTITKHVEGSPTQVLSGATFKLMDSADKTVQAVSAASAADGTIVFNNLMTITGTPQSYKVQEVTPPTDYELNVNVYTDSVTVSTNTDRAVPNTASFLGEADITLTDTNYTQYGLDGVEYTLYWVDAT